MFRLLAINTSGWFPQDEFVEPPNLRVVTLLWVPGAFLALAWTASPSLLREERKGQISEMILTMCLRFRLWRLTSLLYTPTRGKHSLGSLGRTYPLCPVQVETSGSKLLLQVTSLILILLHCNSVAVTHPKHILLSSAASARAAKEPSARVDLAHWGSPDGFTCVVPAAWSGAHLKQLHCTVIPSMLSIAFAED